MTNEKNSSLRTLDRPADRIRQHRQVSNLPILVVEGPEDALVLQQHLPNVKIFAVDGKCNVIEVARTLLSWELSTFVCVTDRDFDDLSELKDIADVHHPYEQRDLESMLIALGVLSQLIEHLGSVDKIRHLGGADKVVELIRAEVAPVSILRKRNSLEGWGLAFDKVDLASKVDKTSLRLRILNYCAALTQASSSGLKPKQLSDIANGAFIDNLGHRGKDVIVFTGVALRKKIGSQPQAVCTEDVLSAHLRSSSGLALSRSSWLIDLVKKLSVHI